MIDGIFLRKQHGELSESSSSSPSPSTGRGPVSYTHLTLPTKA